jgi:hypothetical protein
MQKSQRAEQVKQQVAQQMQNIVNQSNPKNINVGLISTPIVLKITPAPITLQLGNSSAEIEQGGKIEIPITVNRMYGFGGDVNLQIVGDKPPKVKITAPPIAAGKNDGKLALEAEKDAPTGDRKLTVEARVNFNGQLNVRQEITLKVTAKK